MNDNDKLRRLREWIITKTKAKQHSSGDWSFDLDRTTPGELIAEIDRLLAENPAPEAAARDVLAEREKQRVKWGDRHDDEHTHGEMSQVAACLLLSINDRWGLLGKHPNRRDQLVVASALSLAEIERMDRAAVKRAEGGAK